MAKLYSKEDLDLKKNIKEDIESNIENLVENNDIDEIIEEYNTDIKIAHENFSRFFNELFILNDIKESLNSRKLASVEYFVSIENYNLYLKSISNNLGIKAKIPSLEDFKNSYGTRASHQLVLEGFKDFIRSVWEKIKQFFKAFFKKVLLFFKRISNSDLDLEEYEEYIDSLILNVKRSKKTKVESILVDSKLPKLLADLDLEIVKPEYILTQGQRKLNNLLELNKRIFNKDLPQLVKELSSINSIVKTTLINKKDLNLLQLKESISTIRESYINKLTISLFSNISSLQALPNNVYDNVLRNFERQQLNKDNVRVFSIIDDRASIYSLPKNFNIYLITSNYAITESLRTDKIFITTNEEENHYVKNSINTLSNENDIIRLYEFYKKFSKEFNIKHIRDKINNLQTEVEKMINDLEKSFKIALESSENIDKINQEQKNYNDDGEDTLIEGMPSVDELNKNSPNVNNNSSNQDKTENENAINEIYEFQKFLFNYLNSIQILVHEISINIVGVYQICRYELIKYLYKSCRQF